MLALRSQHAMACSVKRRLAGRARGVVTHASTQRALITGGNTGIGFETAKSLCERGYEVILACRDPSRATAAQAKLKQLVPGAAVKLQALDLADLNSAKSLATKLLDEGVSLDVLLNNAGVMACPQMASKDGYEYQLQVNHLGHFLLTTMLLPALENSGKPVRIVNVSSLAHTSGDINFDDINLTKTYQPWPAYSQSKLANVLFTYELTRRLAPSSPVTANTLHPGLVRTELGRYLIKDPDAWTSKLFAAVLTPFTKSPAQGAETNIYLASSPDVAGVTGKYYVDCKPVASSQRSYDTELARRLWDVSQEMVEAATKPAAKAQGAALAPSTA